MFGDYIEPNIWGSNVKLPKVYEALNDIDLKSVYFLLNTINIDTVFIPKDVNKILISFHTEYYNFTKLTEFFNQHSDKQFLFLSDGMPSDIWPSNVTYLTWISYGEQLEHAIRIHGYNSTDYKKDYFISSLSYRHEFHKAAVTAYLINEYTDYLISWHDRCLDELYYLSETFDDFPRIKTYLTSDKFKKLGTVTYDSFDDSINMPLLNGNWNNPAYLNAELNLTNESVFNTEFSLLGKNCNYTTPYLTEKTWKPLLASQPFLAVGQANTYSYLSELGLVFDYGIDLSYDQIPQDFVRMEKLFDLLDQLRDEQNVDQAKDCAKYNLNVIVSGQFNENCKRKNVDQIEKINEWVKK